MIQMNQAQKEFEKQLHEYFEKEYIRFTDREIIIFGVGGYGQWMIQWLRNIGVTNIVGVTDNNSEVWGKEVCGIMCKPINELEKEYPNALLIICSSWEKEIVNGLKCNLEIYSRTPLMKDLESHIGYLQRDDAYKILVNFWPWLNYYEELKKSGKLDKYISSLEEILYDEESKRILHGRVNFLLSGDIKYVESLPRRKQEYFDSEYYELSSNEIYVDIGAYNGDTIQDFVYVAKTFEKIYAFEPDNNNYEMLIDFVKKSGLSNITTYQKATGNENGLISFEFDGSMGSRINQKSESKVEIVRLDDCLDGRVSLIKMDVEGAELSTLKGAENILVTYKPKLAICLYHKPMDIFEIPEYLHEIVPEYKFKLRHHGGFLCDTVLYAWC